MFVTTTTQVTMLISVLLTFCMKFRWMLTIHLIMFDFNRPGATRSPEERHKRSSHVYLPRRVCYRNHVCHFIWWVFVYIFKSYVNEVHFCLISLQLSYFESHEKLNLLSNCLFFIVYVNYQNSDVITIFVRVMFALTF